MGRLLRFEVESGGGRLALGFNCGLFALHVGVGAFPFDGLISLLSHISLYFAYVFRFCVVTMVIRPSRFNLYLLVAATALLAATGCQSAKTKEEKQKATLRIHLETNPLPSGQSEVVNVLRAAPILVSIEKRPFLSEANIADALVAETAGWVRPRYPVRPARATTFGTILRRQFPPPLCYPDAIPPEHQCLRPLARRPLDHRSDQQRHPRHSHRTPITPKPKSSSEAGTMSPSRTIQRRKLKIKRKSAAVLCPKVTRPHITLSQIPIDAMLKSNLLAFLVWLPLPLAAQVFQLPTANRALFDADGGAERFFVPTVGKPWKSGCFGCVRTEGWQMHEGIDIRCLQRDKKNEPTDPVLASADGTVAYINRKPSLSNYGNYLILRHVVEGLEIYTTYAHLREVRPDLKSGDAVKSGETIGILGRTANTREGISKERAHVHFEFNLFLNERFPGVVQKELPQATQRSRAVERPESAGD
jgi:murein DD-endopeptidase MepM/ murein hydrolase activator NlpD